MPRRLSQKLILSLTLIVSLVAAVSGVFRVHSQRRHLLETMVLGADQLSRGITSATWHAMLADRREDAYAVMQTVALKQGIDSIRIFNRAGRIMFSTNAREVNALVDKGAEACSVCHSSHQPLVNVEVQSRARVFRRRDGHRTLGLVTPIYNEPACSQAACHAHPAETKVLGVLDVGLSLAAIDSEIAAIGLRSLVTTAVSVVLIAVFIVFFTRHFVAVPIRKLIEGAQAVSAMDLDRPIEIGHTSEELGELARSFNAMRERLRLALGEINQFTQSLESKVRERTEQLEAAHQKLLQSDRLASLGQLSASVAHEINNPVASILNFSMLMQRIITEEGIPPGRVAAVRRYLSLIISESTRVGRIVSDLLAFSRRSKPERTAADLNRIVRSTLDLAAHKLALANVEIALDLQEDLPSVSCDASQIQQVVINLVLNGAEAVQPRGAGRLEIATRRAGETVRLSVHDSGEGIPPENLPKIFDPFFTTKLEGKGVGLGLAVLYGIVKAHGGDVAVESQPGAGTTFTVTFPLVETPAPAGEGTTIA